MPRLKIENTPFDGVGIHGTASVFLGRDSRSGGWRIACRSCGTSYVHRSSGWRWYQVILERLLDVEELLPAM